MKIRIKKRKANDNSNKVLYGLAFLVIVFVALAVILKPGDSNVNLVKDNQSSSATNGKIQNGVYESTTVSLRVPKNISSISGSFSNYSENFSLSLSNGQGADYKATVLSGASTPREIAQSYQGTRVRVAGNPATLIVGPGSKATLIGVIGLYRFEMETTANTPSQAKALALDLASRLQRGKI